MIVSDAQKRAVNKYIKNNYIQLNIKIRKEKGKIYKEYFKMHPEIKLNKTIENCLDNLVMSDPILSIQLSDILNDAD